MHNRSQAAAEIKQVHELSICQALVRQLDSIASEHPGCRVVTAHLQVGPLSGVDPQLLAEAFSFASAGSIAESAVLDIQESNIQVFCRKCDTQSDATSNKLICRQCGNWQTELISGHELILQQVELESDDLLELTIQ